MPPTSNTETVSVERATESPYKSKGGFGRLFGALRYSLLGLRAAWRHEAAFRQEVGIGLSLLALGLWIAPSLAYGVAMTASIVFVWCVELVNSAIEAVADAISTDMHPLLGRAKDLGSAAVMLSLVIAAAVWTGAVILWLRG